MTTDQAHHALTRARAQYELHPTHWNLCTLERAELHLIACYHRDRIRLS